MTTVVVCPNCRSQLSPCVTVTCPLLTPSIAPCESCPKCKGSATAAAPVSAIPFPYVCRHWLQVSRASSPCSHGHSCSGAILLPHLPTALCPASGPLDTLRATSINGSVLQFQGLSGLCSGTAIKDSSQNSRSDSPESLLILPDIILSINGLSEALQKPWTPEDDERVLASTKEALEACGWYYGALTWQEAAALLAKKPEGTFLVRDSSSKKCPFALSVQTPQGPTSVRIEYEQGKFWLDCEKKGVTPQLGGVIELVQYYKMLAAASSTPDQMIPSQLSSQVSSGKHVWIDHKGRVFSPIQVIEPLRKEPSSLGHLCRLTINSLKFQEPQLDVLPASLLAFLKKYPHSL